MNFHMIKLVIFGLVGEIAELMLQFSSILTRQHHYVCAFSIVYCIYFHTYSMFSVTLYN